jgi:hypothetical protein
VDQFKEPAENFSSGDEDKNEREINTMTTAASAALRPPPAFEVDNGAGATNAPRWKQWYLKLVNYLKAANIKDTPIQVATFLNVAGDSIWDIYHCSATMKTTDTLAQINAIIEAHFAPAKNLDLSTIDFRKMSQHASEGVDAFVVRLRQAAVPCEFGDGPAVEREIRLQLAIGTNSERVREKARAAETSLKDLVAAAKGEESSTSGHVPKQIQFDNCLIKSEPSVFQVSSRSDRGEFRRQTQARFESPRRSRDSSSESEKCQNCGYDWPHAGRCPAEGRSCNKCGRSNHFEKVCKSSRKSSFNQKIHQVATTTSGDDLSTSSERNDIESGRINSNDVPFRYTKEEYESYNCFSVTTSNIECPRIQVEILSTKIDMAIDTQASVNAISYPTYLEMRIKPKLVRCDTPTWSYDGRTPIESAGQFTALVSVARLSEIKSEEAVFIVLKGVRDNLLGYRTCVNLDLVSITNSLNEDELNRKSCNVPVQSTEELLELVDEHSRFVLTEQSPSTSAGNCLRILDYWFSSCGIPRVTKSQKDSPFTSKEFAKPGAPWVNRLIEKFNTAMGRWWVRDSNLFIRDKVLIDWPELDERSARKSKTLGIEPIGINDLNQLSLSKIMVDMPAPQVLPIRERKQPDRFSHDNYK